MNFRTLQKPEKAIILHQPLAQGDAALKRKLGITGIMPIKCSANWGLQGLCPSNPMHTSSHVTVYRNIQALVGSLRCPRCCAQHRGVRITSRPARCTCSTTTEYLTVYETPRMAGAGCFPHQFEPAQDNHLIHLSKPGISPQKHGQRFGSSPHGVHTSYLANDWKQLSLPIHRVSVPQLSPSP